MKLTLTVSPDFSPEKLAGWHIFNTCCSASSTSIATLKCSAVLPSSVPPSPPTRST